MRLSPRGMAVSVPFTDRLTVIQIPVAEKVDNLRASPLAPTVDPSDDEILERLAAGDSNLLVYLFKRYYRLVWTIGMRVLRDKCEAEDLTQDVFLFIFQKSHLFTSSKGHARNWLVRGTYHRDFDRRGHLQARFSQGYEALEESAAHN